MEIVKLLESEMKKAIENAAWDILLNLSVVYQRVKSVN